MVSENITPKISVTIDGVTHQVEPGYTIIQVCDMAGIEIPRFCYQEKLQIAGNCRMCLVSVKGAPKPVASCAMPISDKMEIYTDTEQVRSMRERVMRFLLANHPLDCPICDQGGECDLQDQAMLYGFGKGEFEYNKRAVSHKYFGPMVGTAMTRCIHCTRCVRFMSEIAGTNELGMVGRGGDAEIVCSSPNGIRSELSGNIIDLCPVGALTSKPYAFKARPWELEHCDTIDVMDAVGCSIRVDTRGGKVMRVLPRLNEDVNEIWISDKTRFAYDGLSVQRIDTPYLRKDGILSEVSWEEALNAAADAINLSQIKGKKIGAIAGNSSDCESMFILRELMLALGSGHMDCRQSGELVPYGDRAHYLFNTTIAGIERADLVLLIGVDPRVDAPVLNARIRKRYNMGGLLVANIGPKLDAIYPVEELGSAVKALEEILQGSHDLCSKLTMAVRPMLILGQDIFKRSDAEAVMSYASQIAEKFNFIQDDWNGFNVLHRAAARVGGLDVGFVPQEGCYDINGLLNQSEEFGVLYLLGADDVDMSLISANTVIYQGHHGDNGAHRADIVFPSCTYLEKDCTYVNTEGRPQHCRQALMPVGSSLPDWQIIRDLATVLNKGPSYDTLSALRSKMMTIWPQGSDAINPAPWVPFNSNAKIGQNPIEITKINFYATDSISRLSKNMLACSHAAVKHRMSV